VNITETALGPAWTSNYFDISVEFPLDKSPDSYGRPLPSVFALNASWLPQNYTRATINSTSSIKGLIKKTCFVNAGIVSYDIVLQNGTIKMKYDDYTRDKFVQDMCVGPTKYYPINVCWLILASRYYPGPYSRDGSNTVMGGFGYAADYLFTSTASISGGNAVDTNTLKGALANQFMVGNPNLDPYWLDPTNYMINQIRQIAFRASVQAAKDNATSSNATQFIQYTGDSAETIYVTDFRLIAIAAFLNILAIIVILPTYRGWWKLGRQFSLSPLEIARAFGAPLLRETESNATWEHISEQVGARKVKYGYIDGEGGHYTQDEILDLQFAAPHQVREPMSTIGRRV
jgi:hypothetical protein